MSRNGFRSGFGSCPGRSQIGYLFRKQSIVSHLSNGPCFKLTDERRIDIGKLATVDREHTTFSRFRKEVADMLARNPEASGKVLRCQARLPRFLMIYIAKVGSQSQP